MMPQPKFDSGVDDRTCKVCGKGWNRHDDRQKKICWNEINKNGLDKENLR